MELTRGEGNIADARPASPCVDVTASCRSCPTAAVPIAGAAGLGKLAARGVLASARKGLGKDGVEGVWSTEAWVRLESKVPSLEEWLRR